MTLAELILHIQNFSPELLGDLGRMPAEVTSLALDSRNVGPGQVFVAMKGTAKDGHSFVPQVIAAGALAVVVERGYDGPAGDALLIKVDSTREVLPWLAAGWAGTPTERMLAIGVTGTNGKTSSVYLIEHLLCAAGLRTGVLGTIDHHFEDRVWPTQHTTPDPIALQARLAEMKALGAQGVAMEVSSHALDQRRVERVLFNAAIFTNLTRDHLDYHASETEYFEAKERLFTDLLWASGKQPLFAIVNGDDPWGRRLRVASTAGIWTFGQGKKCDFRFSVVSSGFAGVDFKLKSPFGDLEGHSPLIGAYNVYNLVGAIAAVASVGIPPVESLKFVQSFKGVPGRLERVADPEGGRHVFVDYAHTPDALENVLKTLVDIRARSADETTRSSRIHTLFGCGGDRDRGKRPLMAAVAAQYSDRVVATSDNPRSEDPEKILDEVYAGLPKEARSKAERIVDREAAIRRVLQSASRGDVVLIAGKGHEDYQEIQGERRDFSDVKIARKHLGHGGQDERANTD